MPALAERDRLLAGGQRQQLAEAVHPGRARAEIASLVTAAATRGQVVAHRQHLAARLADGEEPPGLVPLARRPCTRRG